MTLAVPSKRSIPLLNELRLPSWAEIQSCGGYCSAPPVAFTTLRFSLFRTSKSISYKLVSFLHFLCRFLVHTSPSSNLCLHNLSPLLIHVSHAPRCLQKLCSPKVAATSFSVQLSTFPMFVFLLHDPFQNSNCFLNARSFSSRVGRK